MEIYIFIHPVITTNLSLSSRASSLDYTGSGYSTRTTPRTRTNPASVKEGLFSSIQHTLKEACFSSMNPASSSVILRFLYALIPFIHYGDLYSAPSRLLLRSAPDPCTAKKKSFETRVE